RASARATHAAGRTRDGVRRRTGLHRNPEGAAASAAQSEREDRRARQDLEPEAMVEVQRLFVRGLDGELDVARAGSGVGENAQPLREQPGTEAPPPVGRHATEDPHLAALAVWYRAHEPGDPISVQQR